MPNSRRDRKIAVILAADVVGFSRMMGRDEQATLANLNECRAITDKLIGKAKGRVFGSAGDSIIAEFPSAVAAVRCAMQIQTALAARNEKKSDDDRMVFRIGINLGDVLVKEANLFGDGVNIAARLEPLAEPGGICISGAVHDLVASKLDVVFRDHGAKKLKNIPDRVQIFSVAPKTVRSGSQQRDNTEAPVEEESEFQKWMSIVSLLAILAVVAFAISHYFGG